MALSQAALKTELLALALGSSEASAITAWAAAYRKYFEDAVAVTIPVITTALGTPETAMSGAMLGLSVDGGKIADGISAFWGVIALAPVTYFAGTTTPSVIPSGLAGLRVALLAVGVANTTGSVPKDTAVGNMATVIHTASIGPTPGSVTFPGPTVLPIL